VKRTSRLKQNLFETGTVYATNHTRVKVGFTLQQATRAQRGSTGIALLFHDLGTRWGLVVNVTPQPPLPPGKTRYQLYRRLGGPQGLSGRVRKIRPHRDPIPGPSSP